MFETTPFVSPRWHPPMFVHPLLYIHSYLTPFLPVPLTPRQPKVTNVAWSWSSVLWLRVHVSRRLCGIKYGDF